MCVCMDATPTFISKPKTYLPPAPPLTACLSPLRPTPRVDLPWHQRGQSPRWVITIGSETSPAASCQSICPSPVCLSGLRALAYKGHLHLRKCLGDVYVSDWLSATRLWRQWGTRTRQTCYQPRAGVALGLAPKYRLISVCLSALLYRNVHRCMIIL